MTQNKPESWAGRGTFNLVSSSGEIKVRPSDNDIFTHHTDPMTESISRSALDKTISAIEERMDKRVERMEKETDRRANEYRSEIALRDDTIRRELDLRRESFQTEQAQREKAWDERYAGFLAAQAERDKRIDEAVVGIRSDITKLGSLKLNIWGAMLTAVAIGVAVAALSLGFYQTGKADKATTIEPPAISAPVSTPPPPAK